MPNDVTLLEPQKGGTSRMRYVFAAVLILVACSAEAQQGPTITNPTGPNVGAPRPSTTCTFIGNQVVCR